ncbi:MAG: DUF4058 family protein [Gemmataceae bacterium]|nr:DUF4058 family protein [Gemmataceae bacterium]
MPLRDHFRPPLDNLRHWEGFHGQWPAMIVLDLMRKLPERYFAEPRVHLGNVAEYEVRVFDAKRNSRLVAAVEIVSPSNKDRPEHRRLFVAKCAALLQNQVSVTIVDLVTTRGFNLYAELLDLIGQTDPSLGSEPPPLYAAACRTTKRGDAWSLEAWAHLLGVGEPLPTLPLWLAENLVVPLELEASYEETCRVLRIAG